MTSPFETPPFETPPFETPPSGSRAPGAGAPQGLGAPAAPPPGGSAPPSGSEPPPRPRRLHRSADDRVVGGVCGGIAEWSGIDVAVVRIVTVLFMLMGHGLVLYGVAWLLLPYGEAGPSALDRLRERHVARRNARHARGATSRPGAGWDPSPSAA